MRTNHQDQASALQEAKDLLLRGGGAQAAPEMLAAATRAGNPEAPCIMAILSAAGLGREPNWSEAIDPLALSADRGWTPAQAQIALMTGMSPGAGTWRMLAQRIDIPGWIEQPVLRHSLCEEPKVRVVEGLVPPTLCDWITGRAVGRTQP